jgi:alkylated DNA repair dioxygenase AlkB
MITRTINEINDIPSVFHYIPKFMNGIEQNEIMIYLENTNDFRPSIKFNSNISRLLKWYQRDEKYFCPLWKVRYPHWESFKMDDTINNLIEKIDTFIHTIPNLHIPKINSCLINKYPNGDHHISPHRDCSLSFGEKPTIIGLSLGDTRTLLFENDKEKFSFELEPGSILIMSGSSQTYYKHSLLRSDSKNPRYSLTFREFIL